MLLIVDKYFQTFETSTNNIYKLFLTKSCNNYIKYRTICDLYSPQLVLYSSYLLTINQVPPLNVPYLQNICKLFLAFAKVPKKKKKTMYDLDSSQELANIFCLLNIKQLFQHLLFIISKIFTS